MSPTHTKIESPIGELTLVSATGDGVLSGLYFPGHWHPPDMGPLCARSEEGFGSIERQLAEYFDCERTAFELETQLEGADLQRRVWELIDAIPYGETTTYGEIAREIGDAVSAREVGQAVGRNPVSVVVPCHRVVGSDGSLTGYAGGLDRKRFLLELESPAAQLTLG